MPGTKGLLHRVRARWLLESGVEDLERGLVAGAAAAVVVLSLRAFLLPDLDALWAPLAGGALALTFPAVGVLVRRPGDRAVAAEADRRLGLSERVSTALWLERAEEAPPLAALVRTDAESAAGRVAARDLSRAFRPRLLRRPLLVSGLLAAACAGLLFVTPEARAARETEAERAARLADENRIGEVARKLREEAKRVEAEAKKQEQPDLERLAADLRKEAERIQRAPPPRPEALKRLNALSDLAKAEARRRAGLQPFEPDPREAAEMDRALDALLADLARAGLESLDRDLDALRERLKNPDASDPGSRPSPEEVRDLASRVDSLRRALERAADREAGMPRLDDRLRTLANEDLLERVSDLLREMASRMDQGQDYSDLQGEAAETLDLSTMTREELEQLIRDLEELKAMQELGELAQAGGREAAGGRRIRLGGSGGT